MASGINRITSVLQQTPEVPGADYKAPAIRIVICGFVVCQALGFLAVVPLGHATGAPQILSGMLLGILLAAALLFWGKQLFTQSGDSLEADLNKFADRSSVPLESPTARLVRDFYRGFAVLRANSNSDKPTVTTASALIISHLLDHGMTPASRLQSMLVSQDHPEEWLDPALRQLEESGYVTVKANGVSLVPTKRRQFF